MLNALSKLGAHSWHHAEFWFFVAILLFILYVPPAAAQKLSAVQDFVEAHFGDSIGLYILHLGIGLIILAGVFPEMTHVDQIGQSLVLAAMGVLKLTRTNGNGNGHGPESVPASNPPPAPAQTP